MTLSLLDGNEAIARAAIAAGCSFFAGYPITPATSIFQQMLQLLPPEGGVCLQGEDEISSIGFCLGASMAGHKAMTATSGPGISLYSEQISFAIGGEIPLVIVDVMRLGPSTGSATKGADGDIQFLRWGNSGGLPVIVLAPTDVKDSYLLTMHAFNLAERYRCPVFIASNKEIAMTRESIDLQSVTVPEMSGRIEHHKNSGALSFQTVENSKIPGFIPIGGDMLARQTSSTHGEDGYISTDPKVIGQMIERMQDKLKGEVENFTHFEFDSQPGSSTLLIVYGVTTKAAKAALQNLRQNGIKVNLLILKTLYPVPEKLILNSLKQMTKVIVIEMNMGQYVREIERLCKRVPVNFYGQMDGELISPATIYKTVAS